MTIRKFCAISALAICALQSSKIVCAEYRGEQYQQQPGPVDKYISSRNAANNHFRQGQFAQALPLYQEALSLFPTLAQMVAANEIQGNIEECKNLGLCYLLRHRTNDNYSPIPEENDIENAPLASQILALDCFMKAWDYHHIWFRLVQNSHYSTILQKIYDWHLLRPTVLAIHAGTWANNTFFGSRKRCVASCLGLVSIAALAYYRPWQNPALQTALQKVPAFLHACWQRLPWRTLTKSVNIPNINTGAVLKFPAATKGIL